MRPGTCVLIVQGDPYIARLLRLQLKHRNLKTRCEPDGPSGVEAATEFDFELIILDVLLPGMDGVGVLKALRRRSNRVPVIMLTVRNTKKVHSLDLGADDYLTKPFGMEGYVELTDNYSGPRRTPQLALTSYWLRYGEHPDPHRK